MGQKLPSLEQGIELIFVVVAVIISPCSSGSEVLSLVVKFGGGGVVDITVAIGADAANVNFDGDNNDILFFTKIGLEQEEKVEC